MSANAHLVELDLSDNAFGPNGMIGLMDFLKSSSCFSLQELRLNNNGLGIQGGKARRVYLLAYSECPTLLLLFWETLEKSVFLSVMLLLEFVCCNAYINIFEISFINFS